MKWPHKGLPFLKRQLPLFYLLYLVSCLPFGVLYTLSDGLSWLLWRLVGYRKKVVLANLANGLPELPETERKRLAREFYRNLTDVFLETLKLASITPAELLQRIELVKDQELVALNDQGQSVIIVGSHHCNWEWVFAAGPASYTYPVYGVYKPLSSPFFETFMRHLRSRFGGRPIRMKETMRDMVANRHETRIVSMIADQTPPYSEIQHWTHFLHQETAFYAGAEKLARTFKYPVFFLHTRRKGRGRYLFTVSRIDTLVPPDSPGAFPLTDMYARLLEDQIRQQPEAYLWSHRRWKHKRPVG